MLLLAASAALADSAQIIDVTKRGAVGDGVTLNTVTIQKAIDAASLSGGAIIRFPAGKYLSGTIQLRDNITLRLDKDAVLLGSTSAADYRNLDPFRSGNGAAFGYAFIVAVDAKHVAIDGDGTIDGQGAALKATQTHYGMRPFLVRWVRCADVTVKNVHLTNSGAWGLTFSQCNHAAVDHVGIDSCGLSNNDGIDIDSCQSVRITDCDINSGDDAVCLKTTSPLPCRDVVVTGCKLQTHTHAIKLGTESLGDFENIQLSACQIASAGMCGISIYSVDGADIHNVNISDITMDTATVPISIRLGARLKTFRAGDAPKPPGRLRDVTIKNVKATRARQIGMLISGIPNHPIESLTLENIQIELPGGGKLADASVHLPEKENAYPEYNTFGTTMPAFGIYARHVRGVNFKNVQLSTTRPDARPETILIDVDGVNPPDFAGRTPAGN